MRTLAPRSIACLGLLLTPLATDCQARSDATGYFDWYQSNLSAIKRTIPSIVPAADAAADRYIAGKNFGVRGGAGLNAEFGGRSGGLMTYHATRGEPGDVIIYALGVVSSGKEDPVTVLKRELDDAEQLTEEGSLVIAIASVKQLSKYNQLERARRVCQFVLDNCASANDALTSDADGRRILPQYVLANPAVLWAWQGEFFAACTRRGKTPTMWQSIAVDRDLKRRDLYEGKRFHDTMQVKPVKAGMLGHTYIEQLRGVLGKIRTDSWPAIMQTATRSVEVIRHGGKVQVYAQGHYPPVHHRGGFAGDPGHMTPLSSAGESDFAIALGYCAPPGHPRWSRQDALRKAGRGVAWITSGYMNRNEEFVRDNEIFVDQQWAEGDALVPVDGYDVLLCPPSGITAELIMWMIKAQVYHDLQQ